MSEENKNNETLPEDVLGTENEKTNAAIKSAPKKTVTLGTFVVSAIALVVAAVMLTYTLCGAFYKKKLADARLDLITSGSNEGVARLELLQYLFDTYSYFDIDDDEVIENVLKAYVASTGDRYAQYYNKEEYEQLREQTAGSMVGIGVTVVESDKLLSYLGYNVIEVVAVSPKSPAEEAGLKVRDFIVWIGTGENRESLGELGYTGATSKLRGEEGSIAEFTVLRSDGEEYEEKEFSVERRAVESVSVYSSVSENDASVGIVKISQFDLTVPKQFSKAVDDLLERGCTKFVFDVRYNGGGDLASITAVLSYFLEKEDLLISTVGNDGQKVDTLVKPIRYTNEAYSVCDVSKDDIGKYRDRIDDIVVLCNGGTASAAELFTATFRDYELATIIGEKTYGKGSMQTILPLSQFGYEGALKLTTKMYFPPSGEGYDGIGITPDVEVALSDEAKKYNVYLLPQSLDDQLAAALEELDK